MTTVALVGVRSGSKGVIDKNIRRLGGKPLFNWIGLAAKASNLIDDVVFSTDSKEYIKLIIDSGFTAINRPSELADDFSPELDFVRHAVDELQLENSDLVVRLHATSPFQRTAEIDSTINQFVANRENYDSSVFVRPAAVKPSRLLSIYAHNELRYLSPVLEKSLGYGVTPGPRQTDETLYVRGNIIVCPVRIVRECHSLTGARVLPVVGVRDIFSIDIDSEDDFEMARFLVSRFRSEHYA